MLAMLWQGEASKGEWACHRSLHPRRRFADLGTAPLLHSPAVGSYKLAEPATYVSPLASTAIAVELECSAGSTPPSTYPMKAEKRQQRKWMV